jgi:hypothetical protein
MRMGTRASIARFTASSMTFIVPTCVVWCRNSCGRVLLVSGTSQSIYGVVILEPLRVEQACLARGVRQVLVRWRGEPTESTSSEDLDEFRIMYPDFQLKDELGLEGEEMSCGGARTGAAVKCAAPHARAGGGHREWLSLEREISFYFYSLSLGESG